MNDKVLIRYSIDGEFEENREYRFRFNCSSCLSVYQTNLICLDSIYDELEQLDGLDIYFIFKGISRIDNNPVFVIDLTQSRRELKLNDLLDE